MRYFLLLLLLSACSSAPKRHVYYCDGVETCPPEAFTHPGYTPAGAGLPEYLPTEEVPKAPRSPHKRLLPETPKTRREAGIWAGDIARASINDPAPPVSVLGVNIPHHPDVKTAGDAYSATACAMSINLAAQNDTSLMAQVQALSLEQRKCVAAAAYLQCTHGLTQRQEQFAWRDWRNQSEAKRQRTVSIQQKMVSTADAAARFLLSVCPESPDPELVRLAATLNHSAPDPFTLLSPWDL